MEWAGVIGPSFLFLEILMRRVPKFYIAGPFFNQAQLKLIQDIELLFVDHNVPFFSPRLADQNKKKELTDEDARAIVKSNIENISDCDALLAVLDWKMPDRQYVYVVGNPMTSGYTEDWKRPYADAPGDGPWNTAEVRGKHVAGPLNIPDPGTVFEMGFGYALRQMCVHIPSHILPTGRFRIIGFTERPPGEKLNIMLSQTCDGIIAGLEELKRFLNKGDIDYRVAGPWKWKHV